MGEFASKGVAGTGLGLGIAGTALGVLANNGTGILGNLLGGSNTQAMNERMTQLMTENTMLKSENYSDKADKSVYEQTMLDNRRLRDDVFSYIRPMADEIAANKERVSVLETQHKCEIEKAALREQLMQAKIDNCCCQMNAKIDTVAQTSSCGISQLTNAIACINNTLSGITKTIVPKDAICPEYMNRYNSWAAPTATPAA